MVDQTVARETAGSDLRFSALLQQPTEGRIYDLTPSTIDWLCAGLSTSHAWIQKKKHHTQTVIFKAVFNTVTLQLALKRCFFLPQEGSDGLKWL